MTEIIAVGSQKPGSGTTGLTAALAAFARQTTGKRIVLVDAGPRNDLEAWNNERWLSDNPAGEFDQFGAAQEECGATLEGMVKGSIDDAYDEDADYVFIDTGCLDNDALYRLLKVCHCAVTVTEPGGVDSLDRLGIGTLARLMGVPGGIVLNRAVQGGSATDTAIRRLRDGAATRFLGLVRQDEAMTTALAAGCGPTEKAPDSPCADDIRRIWAKLTGAMGAIGRA